MDTGGGVQPRGHASERRGRSTWHASGEGTDITTWVDDVDDVVDGDRRLGDVGREHDLARAGRRRLEDLRLHVRRQVGVDRQHEQLGDARAEAARALRERLERRLDLVLPREEDQDVARQRLRDVHLQVKG